VLILRRLYQKPASALGTTIVLFFIILALVAPVFVPYQENEQIYQDARQPPSWKHWFGTDNLGRDVFSRVMLGTRSVLLLSGVGSFIAVFLGTILGLLSGYYGDWFDVVLTRIFDALLAIPALLLALLLLGVIGPALINVLIVLVILYTPIVGRVVRSVTLTVKKMGFVEAARLQGEPLKYILFREILPSTLPALSVEAALRFSYSIFLVSSLGFLGVGVQPPDPNWGMMVREGRDYGMQTPWTMYFPAGAISLLIIGVNLAADGLKRVLQGQV